MKKLAVLIDADNSSVNSIQSVLEEVAKYGIASVKRVYGDWSSETLKSWREVLLPHAITPVQQFAYTKGKDATDMILIIDAMDLLYGGALDGFCIVSSDSDFTPLASRIRESGLLVYGFGRNKTPEAFRKACDKFIYIENLVLDDKDEIKQETERETLKSEPTKKEDVKPHVLSKQEPEKDAAKNDTIESLDNKSQHIDRATLNLIYKAVKDNSDDNGWANLSVVGQYITAVKPDFDSRNYGRAKLSGLIKMLNLFETRIDGSQMYLKKIKNKVS
ncbi:NYN domain-containing protein [Acinetobacter puyangensis]|uniref:NYN domain-containing protein n=1 Tax=Acinetobacter puyangensis TaxID=1096779 RepID=UPI003A4D4173